MNQKILTSVIALSLLATVPAWGQTKVIKRNAPVKNSKPSTANRWNHAFEFSEGLAEVGPSTYKRGFVDRTGKVVIPCKWHDLESFSEGLALAWDDNRDKCGFIDKTGALVIPFKWSYAESFSEGLAMVKDDKGKCGYIDKSGALVIPCKWDRPKTEWRLVWGASSFHEGLARVGGEEGYGYIDKTGTLVIPCKWKGADSFSEGLAWVTDANEQYHIINKQGQIVK